MSQSYKFLFVEDVMKILGISQSKAYQIMRKINRELEAEGYETIAGRVPRRRFCEKFYCGEDIDRTGQERRTPHEQHPKKPRAAASSK
mgnify:CR=1 FL=1